MKNSNPTKASLLLSTVVICENTPLRVRSKSTSNCMTLVFFSPRTLTSQVKLDFSRFLGRVYETSLRESFTCWEIISDFYSAKSWVSKWWVPFLKWPWFSSSNTRTLCFRDLISFTPLVSFPSPFFSLARLFFSSSWAVEVLQRLKSKESCVRLRFFLACAIEW